MVLEEVSDPNVLNGSLGVLGDNSTVLGYLVSELGQIGLWLKAVGILFVLWLIFQIFSFFNSRIMRKRLGRIHRRMKSIEDKVDLVLKKINKLDNKSKKK